MPLALLITQGGALMNARIALVSSALLLAVLGWACESQAPTAPTSLGPSIVGVSPGSVSDASVALGVKKGKNAVVFMVDATLPDDFCTDEGNSPWFSTSPGMTRDKGGLNTRWVDGDLIVTVTDTEGAILVLNNRAHAVVVTDRLGKGREQVRQIDLYISDRSGNRYRAETLQPKVAIDIDDSKKFSIRLREPAVRVDKLKNAAGGKVVAEVGFICVGDLEFTPDP